MSLYFARISLQFAVKMLKQAEMPDREIEAVEDNIFYPVNIRLLFL